MGKIESVEILRESRTKNLEPISDILVFGASYMS
jgi:hypothetical protein